MMHNTWFFPRNKRKLTYLVDSLMVLNDLVVGHKFSGNKELQFQFEDELYNKGIKNAGNLRARNDGSGGGGARTYFAQLKALGLIFEETGTKNVRLTYSGEALINGSQSFVDIMRYQLLKFQFPSNYSYTGSAAVHPKFQIHPFWFVLKLLADERIKLLLPDELMSIVIIEADSDSDERYEYIVSRILEYRKYGKSVLGYTLDQFGGSIKRDANGKKTSDPFYDIVNTFKCYLDSTQYIISGESGIRLNPVYRSDVVSLVSQKRPFIQNWEQHENYQRRYGCDPCHSKDLRKFDKNEITPKEIMKNKLRTEFVTECMNNPIKEITSDLVNKISMATGYPSNEVEKYLKETFPKGGLKGFYARYREMAFGGQAEATNFENATVSLFENVFGIAAKHVGPQGNTPDIYLNFKDSCAIIDNKAYSSYSISGDHYRRMKDVYIPKYNTKQKPL